MTTSHQQRPRWISVGMGLLHRVFGVAVMGTREKLPQIVQGRSQCPSHGSQQLQTQQNWTSPPCLLVGIAKIPAANGIWEEPHTAIIPDYCDWLELSKNHQDQANESSCKQDRISPGMLLWLGCHSHTASFSSPSNPRLFPFPGGFMLFILKGETLQAQNISWDQALAQSPSSGTSAQSKQIFCPGKQTGKAGKSWTIWSRRTLWQRDPEIWRWQ